MSFIKDPILEFLANDALFKYRRIMATTRLRCADTQEPAVGVTDCLINVD